MIHDVCLFYVFTDLYSHSFTYICETQTSRTPTAGGGLPWARRRYVDSFIICSFKLIIYLFINVLMY